MNVYFQYDAILKEWDQLQERQQWAQAEWKAFVESGLVMPEGNISSEIYSSWTRCRNRGQDPFNERQVLLGESQIEEEIKKNSTLIEAAKPILNEVVEQIHSPGFQLYLYNPNLYLIGRYGRQISSDLDPGQVRREIPLGASQREEDTGTTAINMAAFHKKPYRLTSYDHYSVYYHHISTLAVPLLGTRQQLLGVLSTENLNWPLHRHTMAMLVSCKKNIELLMQLFHEEKDDYRKIHNDMLSLVLEMIDDGIIMVDSNGKISHVNKKANSIIGQGWGELVGFSSNTVWEENNLFEHVLKARTKSVKKNVPCNVGKKAKEINVDITLTPLIKEGTLLGAVGFYSESDRSDTDKTKSTNITKAKPEHSFEDLIGEDFDFLETINMAKEIANADSNVLIQGESGTGKEIFAQSIHNSSNYRNGPFVAVNCSAIPQGLMESELFGYEGGSFTGARKEGHKGKFELAKGGTLFLDEINSMPLEMQAKILRTLQSKTIVRVGGTKEMYVDCRIISATNVDLWEMVRKGNFREDLYYRTNVIFLNIPPLRKRVNDIRVLTNYILSNMSARANEIEPIEITADALELLEGYHWPGNVRELENVLERASILAKSKGERIISKEEISGYRGMEEMPSSSVEITYVKQSSDGEGAYGSLESAEKDAIIKAIRDNKGNITNAAKHLGVARNTLYRKMKKYQINNHS